MTNTTRRSALATLTGSALAAASLSSPAYAAKLQPIRLGGPIYLKSDDPRELAREHRRLGYSAAYCPNAKAEDTVRCREIETAFKAENVIIAEVGAWRNMLDPDAEKRRENIRYVADRLALAEAVGARCCVDIAGSYNPKVWYGPHPKNFSQEFVDATVENIRKLIDEVKPKRTKMTLEMMGWCLPEGPDSYLRLIKAIDRTAFGVHLDICNGINSPERFYNNAAFAEECYRKLGRWIVSSHAKDVDWIPEMQVRFVEVIPGRGQMNYAAFLKGLAGLPTEVPFMLEHLKNAEEYDDGKKYIQKVASENGLTFA